METKNYGLRKENIVLTEREHEMMMIVMVDDAPHQEKRPPLFLLPVEDEPIALLDEFLVKL